MPECEATQVGTRCQLEAGHDGPHENDLFVWDSLPPVPGRTDQANPFERTAGRDEQPFQVRQQRVEQCPCGCRYIHTAGSWWQVVACPDHPMDMGPLDKLP